MAVFQPQENGYDCGRATKLSAKNDASAALFAAVRCERVDTEQNDLPRRAHSASMAVYTENESLRLSCAVKSAKDAAQVDAA
jgi:hypothetical protein